MLWVCSGISGSECSRDDGAEDTMHSVAHFQPVSLLRRRLVFFSTFTLHLVRGSIARAVGFVVFLLVYVVSPLLTLSL